MSQARLSITPADAWSDQRLTPLQCRLLGLIGSYLGKDHRAWPSQSTLARQLGVSRKAVNEGIKALVAYGYVKAERRRRDDGGETSSVYFVVMDPHDRVGMEGYTPSNAAVTPPLPEGDTPCNLYRVTPPVTSGGYTKDTIERTKEEDAFEEAWKAYQASPLKANQTKKLAKAQWPKAVAKAGDARILLAAINAEVAKRVDPDGFVSSLPDMHRWLSQERWQDVAPAETQALKTDLSHDEWTRAMRHWVDTTEWLAGHICPAPDQLGCIAPDPMMRHAAKLRPELADHINRNIEQRSVA